jgi:trk system potassium uptake protein TrkH
MVTCLLGVINFTIYAAISRNNRFELRDNIESRTFFFWTTATLLLAVISLSSVPLLFQPEILTRRIVFVVLAAATNSGFNNLYSGQITTLLTSGAIFAVILSMTVGGMSGSTAGGIKSMRLGIIFKSIAHTVHSSLMPGSARHSSHYHHITRRVLDEATVSTAYTITIIFISAMLIGTLVGIMSGYEPLPASFEAVSAATNCGLSSGIVSATMPSAFKVAIVLSMLMGRFEFITIFAVIISLATSLVPKRVFDRFYQLSLKLRGGTSRENRGSHL